MIKTPTGFCNKIDLSTIFVEPPWQSLIHTEYIATLQGKLSSVGNDLVAGSSSASTPNTLAALAVHLQVLIDGSTDPARDTSSAQIYLEKHGCPQPPRPSAPPQPSLDSVFQLRLLRRCPILYVHVRCKYLCSQATLPSQGQHMLQRNTVEEPVNPNKKAQRYNTTKIY